MDTVIELQQKIIELEAQIECLTQYIAKDVGYDQSEYSLHINHKGKGLRDRYDQVVDECIAHMEHIFQLKEDNRELAYTNQHLKNCLRVMEVDKPAIQHLMRTNDNRYVHPIYIMPTVSKYSCGACNHSWDMDGHESPCSMCGNKGV